MSFDVSLPQGRLQGLLRAAGRAVSGRSAQPVLQGILLTADGQTGILTACGYDMALGIRAEAVCTVAEAGSVVVPHKLCSALVSALPEACVVRLVATGTGTLAIEAAEGRYSLALSHEPDDFPTLPTVAEAEPLALPFGAIKRALTAVAYAASTEESKKILCGVNFAMQGEDLRVSCADGNRISFYNLPGIAGTCTDSSFVVPSAAVKEIIKFGLADDDLLLISHTNSFALFDAGDAAIITNLVAGNYPQLHKVAPRTCTTSIICDRLALIFAVERAAIVANAENGAVKVAWDFGTGDISISAANDTGSAADLVAVGEGSKGEDFDLMVSSRYALDALRHVETELVSIGFKDPRLIQVSPVGSELHKQLIATITKVTA